MNLFLETDNDPKTIAFVAERNEHSDRQFRTPEFEKDRDALKAMIEREDRLIVPVRRGKWLFDFHRSKNNPFGIWRRLPVGQEPRPDAPWETVFDFDAFCEKEGKRWIYSGAVTSPYEPTRVLLILSDGGSDQVRLLEFDTETRTIVEGGFDTPPARAHASWISPDEIAYFGAADENSATRSGWPRVGRRLKRGVPPQDAPILFEADKDDVTGMAGIIDPLFWGGKAGERGIEFFTNVHDIGKASIHIRNASGSLQRLDLPKESDTDYNHTHVLWRAKTAERHPSGSLILQDFLPFTAEPLGKARVLFTPREGQSVAQFALLKTWAAFVVSDRMVPKFFLLDLTKPDGKPQELALPEELQSVGFRLLDADLTLGEEILTVIGQGFLLPSSAYSLDLTDHDATPVLVPLGSTPVYFDADGMQSELLEATSEDGTKVPYHIVLPKTWTKGELPVLMYGYGGFEVSLSPVYSGAYGLWLGQGGAFVQAYIRGGGELGPDWHKTAKGKGRHKAFEDFVAVARDLVKRGYTKPSRIACNGGSNGGLLTSVMLTRYPQDFGAVWTSVPVIDMSRFHLFPSGKAWMDEYGNPDVAEDLETMLAYSPLHQVKPVGEITYPPVYIDSSTNDDRVHPSHARRFAKRLIDSGHEPFFHEYGSGGHGGAGDSGELAARQAMGYSFLRKTIMKG
ncbi:prolyl oligopeptidase family serine peptidase [Neorhizobium sp. T786]|uniref:prolyl oligopeptidase family serine peptidase n=1 Tax=Pseudorhizobium xiangyangii TaxID=2883104 RepID=UPI001CFFCB3F|nr:prolyl oligopeptidase family serine peptidase [Neorhizobium xiangyangii]MCB5203326.1 prolyl oligopeptidase family serine peptidase [Neorhizobium xiangyangii]